MDCKSYETLSPEAKMVFLANSGRGKLGLDASGKPTTDCGNACKRTKQPSTSWHSYMIYGIMAFTILVSMIGVIFAFRGKSHAAKKFATLQHGTNPHTGAALNPAEEEHMKATRHSLYKMTGAR